MAKWRVRRDGKLQWVEESDVQESDEIVMAPKGAKESTDATEVVPVEVAAPANDALALILARLDSIEQRNAKLESENEALRKDLKKVATQPRRQAARALRPAPDPVLGEGYPVPFYNPVVLDEQFAAVPDRPAKPGERYAFHTFRNGKFVANTPEEERQVRLALAAWGPDKPDAWRGDDRHSMLVCDRCGFASANSRAIDAHERRFEHRMKGFA